MRALEVFHEQEQLRLALRETERAQRAYLEAEARATQGNNENNRGVANINNLIESEISEEKLPNILHNQIIHHGSELVSNIPDVIILENVVANYLDEDTIFLILPQLSKSWRKMIESKGRGAIFWKKLCERAWMPLLLPINKFQSSVITDWQLRFENRPRLRLGGPYETFTIYIQYPGPRNMWTPKDAPTVKVVHHHRFWWFLEGGRLLYAAISTKEPHKIIEIMRKELRGVANTNPEISLWYGTYELRRDGDLQQLVCDVDVRQMRHGVKFKFALLKGGKCIHLLRHQSYNFRNFHDIMEHQLPNEEKRFIHYRPGFL